MTEGIAERIVRADGLAWSVRPETDDYLAFDHERFMMVLLEMPRGGVFIDLGAHIGHFSVRLARTASRVIAVEPGPVQRKGLERNLELNGITNVMIVPAAAWDKVTRIDLKPDDKEAFGRYRTVEDPNGPLQATTVDTLVRDLKLDRVDLIKIDIEGAEGPALDGARETLTRMRPRVIVEVHDVVYHDPTIRAHVERALRASGYDWRIMAHLAGSAYYDCRPSGGNENEYRATARRLRVNRIKTAWRKPYLLAQRIHDRLGLMRLREALSRSRRSKP